MTQSLITHKITAVPQSHLSWIVKLTVGHQDEETVSSATAGSGEYARQSAAPSPLHQNLFHLCCKPWNLYLDVLHGVGLWLIKWMTLYTNISFLNLNAVTMLCLGFFFNGLVSHDHPFASGLYSAYCFAWSLPESCLYASIQLIAWVDQPWMSSMEPPIWRAALAYA